MFFWHNFCTFVIKCASILCSLLDQSLWCVMMFLTHHQQWSKDCNACINFCKHAVCESISFQNQPFQMSIFVYQDFCYIEIVQAPSHCACIHVNATVCMSCLYACVTRLLMLIKVWWMNLHWYTYTTYIQMQTHCDAQSSALG